MSSSLVQAWSASPPRSRRARAELRWPSSTLRSRSAAPPGSPAADVAWAQRYLENSVPEIFDYLTAAGVRWLGLRAQEGNRVPRWLRGGASGAPAVLAQRGATCWSVIDARMVSSLTVWDGSYRADGDASRQRIGRLLAESPYITSAPDWTTLAARIGVDAAHLEETMREHNQARRLGRMLDPDFGRPLTGLKPIDEPPYYAMQFFAAARKSLGGVRTDENCQVLRTSGRPVPGLFAAGEVAGMAGGHINGHSALEGTMLGPSLYSGRVAGRAM